MLKKCICALLCVLMITTVLTTFTGCKGKDGNYPLTVGHTKIKEKPEKVAVLSDNLADIIYYLGYSTQICAISDQCTQPELTKYISSVGDESNPDVDAIIRSGAKIVLTDKALSDETVKKLKESDIETINMMVPQNLEEVKTVYCTLGKIFGGQKAGLENASAIYKRLVDNLGLAENEVDTSSIVKIFCYLYLDENGNLCSFSSDTTEGMLLEYLCATNVATNSTEPKIEQSILRLSNPDFIFYDNEEVLNTLKNDNTLKELKALKNNQTYMLSLPSLQRQGFSMLNTQVFMLSKMFPESISENTAESLAELYGITLDDHISFKFEDDDERIVILQQRLIDLGYLDLGEGYSPTTYFGEKTKAAVIAFQTANGIDPTGEATNETIKVLFLSNTLSTEGFAFIPQSTAPETTEPTVNTSEPSTESTNPTQGTAPSGEGMDLSDYKTYDIHSENSEDIRLLNQRLIDLGYLDMSEATDEFDWRTSEAVYAFQEENGLTATGGADYTTLKAIFGVN